jgi:glycosyltransferase involved in cell wall biosynthesis
MNLKTKMPANTSGDRLLTIAIPTYNRHYKLASLIKQLCSVGLNTNSSVIIHVQDNSDENDRVRNEALAQAYGVSYKANATNVGFGGNLLTILQNCDSKYLWYLSDDDDIYPDSIRNILNVLQDGETAIYLIPFTCDNQSSVYNTKSEWNNAKTLTELFSAKLPFILFSSFIIPLNPRTIDTISLYKKLQKYNNNSYLQVAIPIALQALTEAQIQISYFDRAAINYCHARHGRFSLSDMFDSLEQIYDLLLENQIIDKKKYNNLIIGLVRSHLLMALQHKGGLKVIQDAEQDYGDLIFMGLKTLELRNIVLSFSLAVLHPYIVRIVLLRRGHSYVD